MDSKIGFVVAVCLEGVALSEFHSLDEVSGDSSGGDGGLCFPSLSMSGRVVETCSVDDWTLDTFSDSGPLMWLSCLTDVGGLVCEFSTEEFACISVLPHVVNGTFSSSNLTSWKFLGCEGFRESRGLEHVEGSADSWASWDAWADWDLTIVVYPFSALESVPALLVVLEDVTTMMPVALVPGPATCGEA